jgi:hypothetical protein
VFLIKQANALNVVGFVKASLTKIFALDPEQISRTRNGALNPQNKTQREQYSEPKLVNQNQQSKNKTKQKTFYQMKTREKGRGM